MPNRPPVSLVVLAFSTFALGCTPGSAPGAGTPRADGEEEAADTGIAPGDASCALVAAPADVYFLEGDVVGFTVGCSGALATDDADFAALSLPDGATFDPDTRAFAWATGPADGGRIDLSFSIIPHDGSDPGVATLTFWVADDPSRADNVPVDPLTYTEEWGLPVVHVAASGPAGTDDYTDATVTWYGHAYPAGIELHGGASGAYPKPSYALELGAPLPVAQWGGTRNRLLLVSTFDDASYVRQKLTYDLWAAMAAYWGQSRLTPRAFFTVVYLDGAYLGLYLGVDRVDAEFVRQMGMDPAANLYRAVDEDANFALTDSDGALKRTLHQGYDKVEDTRVPDFSDLDALVSFTGSSTPAELVEGSPGQLDLGEWMDAYLLLFYADASDSYTKNMYLYHPAEGGGAFRYVPWDFNASWGQDWRTSRRESGVEDDAILENRIFAALREDPEANAWVEARLDQLRRLGPLALDSQIDVLDGYYSAIDLSARRDWDVWGDAYRTYGGWTDDRVEAGSSADYDDERNSLYWWVADRAAYFDARP